MGPRPFDRGNLVQAAEDLGAGPASMGPRPFDRGNRRSTSTRCRPSGFNGAATFRSRKRGGGRRWRPGRPGFNGAATFRSRKLPAGVRWPARSRCFNGAATFRSRKRFNCLVTNRLRPASMGPRPFDRGNPRVPDRREPADLASMGPRPFDRGNLNVELLDEALHLASMGPRPFDRGNRTMPEPSEHAQFWLQWGRDLSIAETSSSLMSSVFGVGFNGAATFRSRKLPARSATPIPVASASMGPRPFDRGNPNRPDGRRWGRARFNGAATFRSRKPSGAPDVDVLAQGGFNGAATFRSRKHGGGFLPTTERQASMGPRPFDRGN